jgi:hypothetical protein
MDILPVRVNSGPLFVSDDSRPEHDGRPVVGKVRGISGSPERPDVTPTRSSKRLDKVCIGVGGKGVRARTVWIGGTNFEAVVGGEPLGKIRFEAIEEPLDGLRGDRPPVEAPCTLCGHLIQWSPTLDMRGRKRGFSEKIMLSRPVPLVVLMGSNPDYAQR